MLKSNFSTTTTPQTSANAEKQDNYQITPTIKIKEDSQYEFAPAQPSSEKDGDKTKSEEKPEEKPKEGLFFPKLFVERFFIFFFFSQLFNFKHR